MTKPKWFERKFLFDNNDISLFPLVLERLRGIPARLEEKVKSFAGELLTFKFDNSWSVKENVGHLGDLETLWFDRLTDILSGKDYLRLADLENTQTNQAGHNEASIQSILLRFRQLRSKAIIQLESLESQQLYLSAIHPRLNSPMRIADLYLFVAEHDDHHLARISEIEKLFQQQVLK